MAEAKETVEEESLRSGEEVIQTLSEMEINATIPFCLGSPGAQLEEKQEFKNKDGKSIWALPILFDFRRLLELGELTQNSGVIPGVSNQDLLHAVVGLYDTCLSDMTAECIYDHISEKWARTIVLIRDPQDTARDMTEHRKKKRECEARKKEERERKEKELEEKRKQEEEARKKQEEEERKKLEAEAKKGKKTVPQKVTEKQENKNKPKVEKNAVTVAAKEEEKDEEDEDDEDEDGEAEEDDEEEEEDEESEEDEFEPDEDILEDEDNETYSKFAELYSDSDEEEEDEDEEEAENEDEEEEEPNFTRGVRTFLKNAKHRRKERENLEGDEITQELIGIENMVMGCASFEKKLLCKGERVIHLTFLGVRKRARKLQMGRYLLFKCLDVTVVGSYEAVVVHADSGAVDFFAKFGFTDDTLLNSKWNELAEQFTQCTLMSYLPGFSLTTTAMIDVTTILKDDPEVTELEKEFKKWQQKSLEMYQTQVFCMKKMQHEILQLKLALTKQTTIVDKLLTDNEKLRKEKLDADRDLLNYRLEAARSVFKVVSMSNGGDQPEVREADSTELLIQRLESRRLSTGSPQSDMQSPLSGTSPSLTIGPAKSTGSLVNARDRLSSAGSSTHSNAKQASSVKNLTLEKAKSANSLSPSGSVKTPCQSQERLAKGGKTPSQSLEQLVKGAKVPSVSQEQLAKSAKSSSHIQEEMLKSLNNFSLAQEQGKATGNLPRRRHFHQSLTVTDLDQDTAPLIQTLEQEVKSAISHLSGQRAKAISPLPSTSRDESYQIQGSHVRSQTMAYDPSEDVFKFSDIALQFKEAMKIDNTVRTQYEVTSIIKAVMPFSVEQRYHSQLSKMADPTMVTRLYFCGTLLKPHRCHQVVGAGFSREDFAHGEYGFGLYFSKFPSKAAQFSAMGKVLVAEVGLGAIETIMRKDRTRMAPSAGYDSLITPGRLHRSEGDSRGIDLCQEYVVFSPDQALPICLLNYQAASKRQSPTAA